MCAEELLAIRNGSLDYETLRAEAERLQHAMREAASRCTLPADVDHDALDTLVVELLRSCT